MLKKIVVIGPESTGKSTLCEELARHYKTLWCPEYAREYLQTHGTKYSYADLLTIAKEQIELEEEFTKMAIDNWKLAIKNAGVPNSSFVTHPDSSRNSLLFVDTDMYVMKVWCEFVFGKCHPFILDQIAKRKYDLYLLCNIDLQWEYDEMREYPDIETRQKLYTIYKELMVHQPVPWAEISGNNRQRIDTAIQFVDEFLKV